MATVILENVSAHFPIYGAQQRSLRKAIFQRATGGSIEREGNSDRVTVRALSDISLTLHDGDRVGLIGHNGAGKSTLLKLIAGIYEPVTGSIKVEGRITPLFDTMPGLDGEDTGYENIITSGMLIGLTRRQIEAKIPEIEEFCELGEYLSLPVRTYSTGMAMRLGFALVTALDPGVLLMDEGFGTGDLRFAERAEGRMKDFIGRSRIMVLASHSDKTIRSMCNKAIIMEAGRAVAFGPVNDICDQYYEAAHAAAVNSERARLLEKAKAPALTAEEAAMAPESRLETDAGSEMGIVPVRARIDAEGCMENVGLVDRRARTNGAARLTRVTARDANGNSKWDFAPGETAIFRIEYKILERVENAVVLFRLNFYPPGGGEVVFADLREVISSGPLEAGYEGVVEMSLKVRDLLAAEYSPYVWIGRTSNVGGYDVVDANVRLPSFVVRPASQRDMRYGLVSLAFEASKSGTMVPRAAGKAEVEIL